MQREKMERIDRIETKIQLPRATFCVLLYGDHADLARRCIGSILRFVPQGEYALRIGMNACNRHTVSYVEGLSRQTDMDLLVRSEVNLYKCPMMRKLFWDKPIETEWVVWFDDDTHILSDGWWAGLWRHLSQHAVDAVGELWWWNWEPNHWNFVKESQWFRGVAPQRHRRSRRPGISFMTGAYWVIKTLCLRELDWPDLRLVQKRIRHEDKYLSEAMRQGGWRILNYAAGIKVNDSPTRTIWNREQSLPVRRRTRCRELGGEIAKVSALIQPYVRGNGMDLGCWRYKVCPGAIGVDRAAFPAVNWLGDARDLSWLADGVLDYVVASHILEDCPDDPCEIVKEWLRVLKGGGTLILFLPDQAKYEAWNRERCQGTNPSHCQSWTKESFAQQVVSPLAKAGKVIVLLTEERREWDYCFLFILQKMSVTEKDPPLLSFEGGASGADANQSRSEELSVQTEDPIWHASSEMATDALEKPKNDTLDAGFVRLPDVRAMEQRLRRQVRGLRRQLDATVSVLRSIILDSLSHEQIQGGELEPNSEILEEYKRKILIDWLTNPQLRAGLGLRVKGSTPSERGGESSVRRVDCQDRRQFCRAACCRLSFALAEQEIRSGRIHWSLEQPFMRVAGPDGYCVHLDRRTLGCLIYENRPHVCRRYSCRNDKRIWEAFETKRISSSLRRLFGSSAEPSPAMEPDDDSQ